MGEKPIASESEIEANLKDTGVVVEEEEGKKEEKDPKDAEIEYLKNIIVSVFEFLDVTENEISNMRHQLKQIFKNSPMNRNKLANAK